MYCDYVFTQEELREEREGEGGRRMRERQGKRDRKGVGKKERMEGEEGYRGGKKKGRRRKKEGRERTEGGRQSRPMRCIMKMS